MEQLSLLETNVRKRRTVAKTALLYRQIIKLYSNGLSIKACAKKLNTDKNMVKIVLRKNNISIRPQKYYQPNTVENSERIELDLTTENKIILDYKFTELTKQELRTKYGTSFCSILKTLKGVKKLFVEEKTINQKGYILSVVSKQRTSNRGTRRILEHKLVAEQMIGRPLTQEEQVHHVNLDKQDNDPINLAVLNNSNHGKAHASLVSSTTQLIKLGIITFSKETNTYSVAQGWLDWYEIEGQHRFNDSETHLLPKKLLYKKMPLFVVK